MEAVLRSHANSPGVARTLRRPGRVACFVMSKTAYAVCATAWDYNDEYNYTPEGDPSFPIAVFLDKDAADRDMHQRELNAWRGAEIRIYEYCYGESCADYVADVDAVAAALKTEFGYEGSIEEYAPETSKMSNAQLERLMDLFPMIYFHSVQEVVFDGTAPADPVELPEPGPEPIPEIKLEPEFSS